ncbi:hypothetical protein K439DRAFT_1622420 [Ramaria rubella]|nr:hypothetical protein K439DRAFT_1622420 [Ramaria rubella]
MYATVPVKPTVQSFRSLSTTFCGSLGSQLLSHVSGNYSFGNTEKWVKDNIVKQLLSSGNLVYKKVFLEDAGFARLTSNKADQFTDYNSVHRPFQNPLLETIIISLAFKGHLPLAATNPHHFDSIPLPIIMALTLLQIHHALDHHLTDDSSSYLEVWNSSSMRILGHVLWYRGSFEKGRKVAKIPLQGPQVIVYFTSSLSAEAIEAELVGQCA